MIFLLIFGILAIGWLISAWSTMVVVGMVHHEVLHDVIAISYVTSLKFSGVALLFAIGIGILKGVMRALLRHSTTARKRASFHNRLEIQ